MDNRPIGLLDSGVGGLTVARELMQQLPNEEIIYIGDSRRAPYGPRPAEEIRTFTWQMVHFLLSKNVKMIVFACNTATAVALDEVREQLDIPVMGVILPGATAAIQQTRNKRIGVIGTQATIASNSYLKAIRFKSPDASITSLACPRFVPLVESNETDSPTAQLIVNESLEPLVDQVDTLILGCTHYPLIIDLIANKIGGKVRLIDSGRETVRDIAVLLDYFLINGVERGPLQHQFYTTAGIESFRAIASQWLGREDIMVDHADLEGTSPRKVLVIATRNPGKVEEFRELFAINGYQIKSLLDFPDLPDIEETGSTFEENARLKAETIAAITGEVVIGDDSGLCVDVLGGLPGIWSHRFAGSDPTDFENNIKLLHELASTELTPERRTAHYHTTLVAARPDKESLVVEADWPGRIALRPQGDGGFGYDPLFLIGNSNQTAAELDLTEKNKISHRGQALQKLFEALPNWLS